MRSEIIESQGIENQLDVALVELDAMLKNLNPDQVRLFEMAYKVMILVMATSARNDRQYALNKDPELKMLIEELKGTYNRKDVLIIQSAFAGAMIFGGCVGMGSLMPGSSVGAALAAKSPGLFGGLVNAQYSTTMTTVGNNVTTIGKGGEPLGQIFSSKAQGTQTVVQFRVDEAKRLRSERDDASRKSHEQQNQSNSGLSRLIESTHDLVSKILS